MITGAQRQIRTRVDEKIGGDDHPPVWESLPADFCKNVASELSVRQKKRFKKGNKGGRGEEVIGKRRTLNHDFNDGCQGFFEVSQ